MTSARKKLLLGTPTLNIVMSPLFVSHLGYPGEGPARRGVVRNPGGLYNSTTRPQHPAVQRVAAAEMRTPSPLNRPQRQRVQNVRLADDPGSSSSRSSTPASAVPPATTPESDDLPCGGLPFAEDLKPEDLHSHFNRVTFITKFKTAVRQLRYFRKEHRKLNAAGALEVRGSRGFGRKTVSDITVGNRVRESAIQLKEIISAHPEGDEQAAIVARVLEHLPMPSRLALRKTSPMLIEQYVFVRDALQKLKTEWWTPYNWLELRLKKFISHSTFAYAHRIFSQTEDSEGRWNRVPLLPMPSPQWRARAFGIYAPLWVPSFMRTPGEMSRCQDIILKDHTISTSNDGKGAHFDPTQATSDCINHCVKQGNLRPLHWWKY